ncbi:DUF262 domain-containing protein [Sinorhizobium meliloti]|uniref:DUF262 domain-containing protein n=1 Tax=Rhizobium meliloti TaxID=382 RepID=UPI000FD3BCA2|nr:DUF262 domain-containing protein [Sinorhizobium meliloti]RVM09360.1 DUF262 domain-containing protein [Sinorhizobium meliloti]RVM49998.1 DUF262 domain-containing protein [Sinorhizobium meliloti]RVM66781.1 DUF262 domain-containing protein [Sinorhizobium meliloti]RVM72988.1 DUF262 domain-containing protein [Sinorhizobium meliloti]RVM87618.1 DUF262 domain-containing protein [Sinorhizobium meliloti]
MPGQRDFFGPDEFLEVSDQAETVEDIAGVDQRTVSQAVVSATDWTTETVISQINKGNIQLNPRFQRRDAWEPDRKSRFIESLILGLPIPQLVLAEVKNKRGSYIVIDGKQRLLSIRQFAATADDPLFSRLRLSGLSIRQDLRRLSLVDLRDDPGRSDDLAAFENQPIRTVVIKNWENEDFLYQVFLRLNTGSVPLSPQELRQALHPGPFVEFADLASGDSPALRELLKLKRPDFRMRDAELLIRWYAFQHFFGRYSGDLKGFLDLTCESLNDQWNDVEERVRAELDQFEAAYATAKFIFGQNVCRKWTPEGYEKPFNRAIYDVLMFYFAQEAVRQAAAARREDIEQAFKDLCEQNPEFLGSIERTTKSIGATSTRFSIWARELNRVLGLELASPFPAA